jgi:hypothetical protein
MSFFVYFIGEVPFANRVKIGKSVNPERRLGQLQTGCPTRLTILHKIALPTRAAMTQLETTIHRDLRGKNIMNEWFHMTSAEVDRAYWMYGSDVAAPEMSFTECFEAVFHMLSCLFSSRPARSAPRN